MLFQRFITLLVLPMLMLASNQSNLNIPFARIEKDTASWFEQFSKPYTDGITCWYSSYKDPAANGLIQLTVTSAQEILFNAQKILPFMEEKKVPFVWTVNAHDDVDQTSAFFEQQNFIEETSFLMLHDMQDIAPCSLSDLEIRHITIHEIDDWLEILNLSFGEYDPAFTKKYRENMHHDISAHNNSFFAGFIDKQLIAIGRVFLHTDYAYIMSVATHPAFRKRGIATQLVKHLLHVARENNAQSALLDAGSAASLYKKLGFKPCLQLHTFIYVPVELAKRGQSYCWRKR